jgi:hypothetical protein
MNKENSNYLPYEDYLPEMINEDLLDEEQKLPHFGGNDNNSKLS